MNKTDQTAPETTEAPALTNMSVDQFASRLASKRKQPLSSAPTGTTPAPAAQPESELAGDAGAQATEGDNNSTDETVGDGQVTETEGSPAAPQPQETPSTVSGVHPEVLEAIRAAGIGADQAGAVAKMAKRIQAVVDDRDAERNRRLELERTIQAKPQGQQDPAPVQTGPIVHPKLASLDTEINTIRAGLKTIAANRDGYTARNADGTERVFTAEELEEIRVDNEARLAELSAERRMTQRELEQQEQAQRETATAEAQRQYPWINQRDSQEYQLAINELRQLGPVAQQLKQSPAFALIVGRYVRGLQAERAEAARAATAGSAPASVATRPSQGVVPPKVVPGSSSKSKVNPFAAKLKAAEEEMVRSGGSKEAYAKLRSLRRQAAVAA